MYGIAYHDKLNKYIKEKKEQNGKILYAGPTPNNFTDLSYDT
jgi:hypothetical protein